MRNRWIFTPYFLDEFFPGLDELAMPDWILNKPVLHLETQQQRMSELHKPISDFVAHTMFQGERPISIAGDCCAAIGVLAGVQRAGFDPVVLWLDAHGDFNTWETTPSGFLGGMPLAMMVGRGEQTMLHALEMNPAPSSRVLLVGGRILDPGERKAIIDSKVIHIEDCQSLLDHPLLAEPLLVHLDPDILDPKEAPAMSYPAEGGPSFDELRDLLRSLSQTRQIIAVSMSTWNPDLDKDGSSQRVCLDLLNSLIEEY